MFKISPTSTVSITSATAMIAVIIKLTTTASVIIAKATVSTTTIIHSAPRGVEPLSESTFTVTSPGAVCLFAFPP